MWTTKDKFVSSLFAWSKFVLNTLPFQAKRQRVSYEQVKGDVQASDVELQSGMRKARVITIDGMTNATCRRYVLTSPYVGELKSLSLRTLTQFLLQAINVVVSQAYATDAVPLDQLAELLNSQHCVIPEITTQVSPWFGEVVDDVRGRIWKIDSKAVVQEVGLGLLSKYKVRSTYATCCMM